MPVFGIAILVDRLSAEIFTAVNTEESMQIIWKIISITQKDRATVFESLQRKE